MGVCEGECMGHSSGDEPLTLTRCHSYMKPVKKFFCGRAYNLKGIKGKFSVFLIFLKLCFTFTVALFLAYFVPTPTGRGDSIININK